MSDTTITADERRLLRTGGYGDYERLRLLNALEQAEAQLAAALQVNAARQAAVTADMLNAMMAGITGQKESVRVEVEGFQCPYCNETSKTIEDATAHDAECPKHPAVIRAEQAEANVARLTKALETQRNLTASAHATAQAAWGGEIPSPFPGHKPPSEEAMVELFEHLNCPLCGGSGHIDDCDQTSAEAIARLTKMVDFMAQQMADVYSTDEDGRYTLTCPVRTLRAADHDCDKISCPQCWKEAARRAVAGAESEVEA